MRFVKRLWGLFQNVLFRRYLVVFVEDIPNDLKTNILYIVHDDGAGWLAVFICPCGCSDNIFLNLLKTDQPKWKIQVDQFQFPNVTPSVWRTAGCKSHFFLRQGSIRWVK